MASESQAADVRFSVLTFNVHNGSPPLGKSETNIIEDQVRGIESILKKTKEIPNLLIHAQDRIRGQKRESLKTTLILTDAYFKITDNETAGIFLDDRKGKKCKGTFLPATDLPHHKHLKGRLSAFLFDASGTASKQVLMMSYHGRNGRNNQFTPKEKKRSLKKLIEWVKRRCTKSQYYGAVVAGDFNLTMAEAKTILPDSELLFVPDDQRFQTSIDFAIVFWPDNIEVVGSPEVLRLSGDWDNPKSVEGYTPTRNVRVTWERSCKAVPPFDHPRVLFHFKLVLEVDKITKGIKKLPVSKTRAK